MKIAHINTENQLLGWYDTKIHEEIPTPNIEVTKEQWQDAVTLNHNKINSDGTSEVFDFRTEEQILKSIKEEIKNHFSRIMDNGFQFNNYWVTCKRSQQDDLLKLIMAVEMIGVGGGNYRVYNFVDGVKSDEKEDILFSISDLREIFKNGGIFLLNKKSEEETMINSLDTLTLQQLEAFEIL